MSKNKATETYRKTVQSLTNSALTQEFFKQTGTSYNYAQEVFEEMNLRGLAVPQNQHR